MKYFKYLTVFFGIHVALNTYAWKLQVESDDFRGTKEYYITSDRVKPNRPLSFPYENPTVYMYYSCKNHRFTLRNSANNLSGEKDYTDNGIIYEVDVRIDNRFNTMKLHNSHGSEFFTVYYYDDNHLMRETKKEFVIQLNHYGDGLRHYTFNMTTFDENKCPYNPNSIVPPNSIAPGDF